MKTRAMHNGYKKFLEENFMRKSLFQKVVCFVLSVATLLSVAVISVSAATLRSEDELADRLKGKNSAAATLEEMQAVVGTTSYEEYAGSNVDKTKGPGEINLENATAKDENQEGAFNVGSLLDKGEACEDASNWPGFNLSENSDALYLSDESKVSWSKKIPEGASGLYWIKVEYYTCNTIDSSISSIERKLYINGSIPFSEAGHLNLTKYWGLDNIVGVSAPVSTNEPDGYYVEYEVIKDEDTNKSGYFKYVHEIKDGMKTVTTYRIKQDINNNSMAPDIVQSPSWNTY